MPTPRRVLLEFDPSLSLPHEDHPVRDNLSVAVQTGNDLWIASDEGAMLERLTAVEDGRFARHTRFSLRDFLDLPADDETEEVDVEGIGFDGRYLWVTGSHSLKRKKPKARLDPEEQIERLAKVAHDPNRYILGRIPCVENGHGSYELQRESEAPRKLPFTEKPQLFAGQLRAKGDGNELTRALEKDEHIGPFLDIPGKDNGFDVEGMAIAGDRVLLGLRGPVLRGFAVVLSLQLEPDADDPHELRLKDYRKHFLDLSGMGIRELRPHGRDVLILAGPTMALDGTIAVFRWENGTRVDEDTVVHAEHITRLFDVPHGPGVDRAEGLAVWSGGGDPATQLLVVYDSPSDDRKVGDAAVYADLYPLS